jgi:hypothetical protein
MDPEVLILDSRVHSLNWANLRLIFTRAYWFPQRDTALYRPLVTLSWLANYVFLHQGDQPLSYHCLNFALHLANTLMVWLLAGAVLRRPLAAFFTGAVFAIHPISTEAVANIGGRADLMSAAAVLAALVLYARFGEGGGRRGSLIRAALFVLAVAGLLSKESAVVLPALMILYDCAVRPERLRGWKKALGWYLPVLYGLMMTLFVRQWVLSRLRSPEPVWDDNPISMAGFVQGRLTAMGVILRYIKILIWPRTLSCDYSYNQIPLVSLPIGLLFLTGVVAILAAVAWSYRKSPAFFFFGMLFFVALFPASNVVITTGTIMGERLAYLPSVGFAGCAVLAVFGLAGRVAGETRRTYAAAAILSAALVAMGIRTYVRNFDWVSDEAVWTRALTTVPHSWKPSHGIAAILGNTKDQANLDRAIELENQSIAILETLPPEHRAAQPYATMGGLWLLRGDDLNQWNPTEARAAYENGLKFVLEGKKVDRAYNAYKRQGDLKRGIKPEFLVNSGDPLLNRYLAALPQRLGLYQEALDAEMYNITLSPADAEVHAGIADLYQNMGNREQAAHWAATAMLLAQGSGEYLRFADYYGRAHPNSCPALIASLDNKVNLDCPQVRDTVCAAERSVIRLFEENHFRPNIEVYYARGITGMACGTAP